MIGEIDTTTVKLFVGFELTAEMKHQLYHSKAWQHASVLQPAQRDVIEIHHHGNDYIGRYLSQDKVILADVRATDNMTKQALKNYCPDCNLDELTVRVFPQVFVS